jgi:hypothetical protein
LEISLALLKRVLLSLITPQLVWAGGLNAPFAINTTQVLPKGIRSFSVGGMTTTVDGWFNDNGVASGVAEPFNLELSYGRLLKAESDENLKLNVESQLRNKGVTLDEVAGNSFADINTQVFVTLPSLAYGVTDRWTLAVAVPIVRSIQDVETGFVGTTQLQQLVTDFSQQSRSQTGLIEDKLRDVIATELANKGYKPLVDREETFIGDVTLVSKYLAAKTLTYSWAIVNTLTLPTGHFRDTLRIADPTPGDGQVDLGIASIFEMPLSSQWRLVNQTGYTFQFSDIRETRIPFDEEERLSRDLDPGANRNLGDMMTTSFAALYSPMDLFNLGASYTIGYKERDVWTGTLASPDRYRALGVETEQFMQAIYLQAGISTIGAYRRKTFFMPMIATLGMGQVVDGRNVRNDPLWSLNMSLFF